MDARVSTKVYRQLGNCKRNFPRNRISSHLTFRLCRIYRVSLATNRTEQVATWPDGLIRTRIAWKRVAYAFGSWRYSRATGPVDEIYRFQASTGSVDQVEPGFPEAKYEMGAAWNADADAAFLFGGSSRTGARSCASSLAPGT